MTNAVYAKHQAQSARRMATERHRRAYWSGRIAIWHNDKHDQLRAAVARG